MTPTTAGRTSPADGVEPTGPSAPPQPSAPPGPPRSSGASEGPATTAVSPDARQLWRSGRGLLVAAAVLLATGLVLGLLNAGDDGTLHPRSATQHGSRAVAELLADHGVDTTLVTTAAEAADAAGPDTTVVVVRPDTLTDRQRATLDRAAADSGGRTVLVAPDQDTLDVLTPGISAPGPIEATELAPDCVTPDGAADAAPGRRAGSALLGGGFHAEGPLPPSVVFACYPVPEAPIPLPTLLALAAGDGGDTVLLGSPHILYNQHLGEAGNASLALQLLGTRPHLVWYMPSAADAPAPGEERSLTSLLDPGWRWATLQLGIAAVLTALWRARRLGPVVTESLPVTVPAAETTEGRARLYHATRARGRAADALRAASRGRLTSLLGLPTTAMDARDVLPSAIAARVADSPSVVDALLFGPPPADDSALIRLADELDALEGRVAPRPGPAARPPTTTSPPPAPSAGDENDKDARP
ncbi:DUF4350 domain-containing protein [Streptomyces sp. 4N509B]|uniref:DUF4350 domain-containing protein n=1 Tax=Streptomyces sp. 4N509B TaxID=3457413 RepID=UPI003FD01861